MVKTHISPKGINRGGFLQNHAAVDGDDMAVHNVGSSERRLLQMRSTALYQKRLAIYNFDDRTGKFGSLERQANLVVWRKGVNAM